MTNCCDKCNYEFGTFQKCKNSKCPCHSQQAGGWEEIAKDSAQFANFAQRVKMEYWKRGTFERDGAVKENDLDNILLVAWEDFHTLRSSLKQEMLVGLPGEKKEILTGNAMTDAFTRTEVDGFNACLKQVRDILEKI